MGTYARVVATAEQWAAQADDGLAAELRQTGCKFDQLAIQQRTMVLSSTIGF